MVSIDGKTDCFQPKILHLFCITYLDIFKSRPFVGHKKKSYIKKKKVGKVRPKWAKKNLGRLWRMSREGEGVVLFT